MTPTPRQSVLEAEQALWALMETHKSATIPAMIGACVMWAVDNGGTELIKATMRNAINMADQMEAAKKEIEQ